MTVKAGVLVAGSCNVDLVVRGRTLPRPGETVLGQAFFEAFGGKGANQAVAARRAGARVELVACLGTDAYGARYASALRREGVGLRGIRQVPGVPTGVALIVVDGAGRNQIAVAPGANHHLRPRDLVRVRPLFARARVLLVQLEVPLATVQAALRLARQAGVITILDPAPAPARPLPRRLLRLVDLVTPNEHEAELLTGIAVRDLRGARAAGARLCEQGCGAAIITLGARGALHCWRHGARHVPPVRVRTIDSTAAGDAFNGALAAGLAAGRSLEESLHEAACAGALATTRLGAQPSLPHLDAIQRLARRRSLRPPRPRR
ncbi:MAG: ribokinase [Deltaproteobacteria bacterium]|nr:ribokinase [Deltaproteobacteria bacterium]